MQMQMQMAVDMIERQTGGVKFLKLRMDFGAKLSAQAALEKVTEARGDRLIAEFAVRIDKAGDFFRRQRGLAAEQSQMQADAEFGILPREFYGLVKTGFVHHQACGGQNAVAVRADDGFIDGWRQSEIVGVDNEPA